MPAFTTHTSFDPCPWKKPGIGDVRRPPAAFLRSSCAEMNHFTCEAVASVLYGRCVRRAVRWLGRPAE